MDNPHDRKGGSLVVRSISFQQNDLNSWKFKIIFTQGMRGGGTCHSSDRTPVAPSATQIRIPSPTPIYGSMAKQVNTKHDAKRNKPGSGWFQGWTRTVLQLFP